MKEYLQRFSYHEQKIIQKYIEKLKLSFSNQQKFMEYIYEILKREEDLSFDLLMDKLAIDDVLNNEKIQGKNKGEKILKKLFQKRFPETATLIAEGNYEL